MALDRLFVALKVGDLPPFRDGMVVDLIDESQWQKPIDTILSPWCKRVYRFVEIDRRMEPKIREMLKPLGVRYSGSTEIIDDREYRVKGGIIPMADLSELTRIPITTLRNQETPVDIINGRLMGEDIIKSASLFTPDGTIITDRAAISAGSFTIGSGGDYTTIQLFIADTINLTGALTGTVISAITESSVTWFVRTLGGFAWTLTSNLSPLGNPLSGNLVSINSDTNGILRFNLPSTSGSININKQHLKFIVASPAASRACIMPNGGGASVTYNINDCIVNGNSKTMQQLTIGSSATSCLMKVFNMLLFKLYNDMTIFVTINTSSVLENITSYNQTVNGFFCNSKNFILKNIASFNGTIDYTNTGSLGTFSKCASSDATGSEAGLRSLVAANNFESLDIAAANYLKAKTGGAIINGGVAPSVAGNTYGIRGNARPHGALYSIGADEGVALSRINPALLMSNWGQM